MTKNFKVEIINNGEAAVVTKAFGKKAKMFGTDEYKFWREVVKEFPDIIMKTKEIKKNPDKETYKNMTYDNMRAYIREQDGATELMAEFEKQIRLSVIKTSPYRAVLAWFCQKFEGYNDYKKYFEALKKTKEVA